SVCRLDSSRRNRCALGLGCSDAMLSCGRGSCGMSESCAWAPPASARQPASAVSSILSGSEAIPFRRPGADECCAQLPASVQLDIRVHVLRGELVVLIIGAKCGGTAAVLP